MGILATLNHLQLLASKNKKAVETISNVTGTNHIKHEMTFIFKVVLTSI